MFWKRKLLPFPNSPHQFFLISIWYHTTFKLKIRRMDINFDERTTDMKIGYFNITEETAAIIKNIREAIGQQTRSTHVITGLLTALVLILTTFVIYLCFSRGISSMSKYVMWYMQLWMCCIIHCFLCIVSLKETLLANKVDVL